jgi:hypothetical protein
MVRRHVGKLDAPGVVESVGADKERVRPFAHKRCECRIDFAVGTGIQDLDLHPDATGSSREGGYLYIWGGPYDAHEQLFDEFGSLVPEQRIQEIANEIVGEDGISDWAPGPDHPDTKRREEEYGVRREQSAISNLRGPIPGRIPEPRVGRGSQHSDRPSLGCILREVDGTIQQRTLGAATRRHSFDVRALWRRLTECAKGSDPDLLSVGWVATACAIHAVSCSPPTVELLSALDCITAEFAF